MTTATARAALALDRLPTLAGRGVELRELSPEDAEDIFGVFSDPAVMRYWSTDPMRDIREARELIDQIAAGRSDGSFYQWGVVPGGGKRVVGTVTLFAIELRHRRAELGFALGSRWWGRGIATSAVTAVIEYAFGSLGLHRLEADADPRNSASLGLLERLGFRREGLLRERYRVAGEVQDSVFLGLLAQDWPGGGAGAGGVSR